MWSAGVILLCIVSGCYPFFRSPDDITALSEFITVFGTTAIISVAKKLGRNVVCGEIRKPLNLRLLCERLRRRKLEGGKSLASDHPICIDCHHANDPQNGCLCESKCRMDLSESLYPDSAIHLLRQLLDIDPETRITAVDALNHHFLKDQN